jgi:3-methyladenine DNA glycosylase AlkD
MTDFSTLPEEIAAELQPRADPAYRELVQSRYNMDVSTFLGVRTPIVHRSANRHYKLLKSFPIEERLAACTTMLEAKIYELKVMAFRWAYLSRNDLAPVHLPVLAGWLARYIDDWIDCDDLCIHVLGEFFVRHPELADVTRTWTRADNRWVRRGAAVAIIPSARKGKLHELALDIADLLLDDNDNLIQKAYGWLLKEASKADPQGIYAYLMQRRSIMPRLAFRYALEKMPDELRRDALAR